MCRDFVSKNTSVQPDYFDREQAKGTKIFTLYKYRNEITVLGYTALSASKTRVQSQNESHANSSP